MPLVRYSKNPCKQFLYCSTVMPSLRHRKNTNYNMEHIIFIFWQSYEIMGKGIDLSLSLKFLLPCASVKCTLYGFSSFFPLRSETMSPTSLLCLASEKICTRLKLHYDGTFYYKLCGEFSTSYLLITI